MKNNKNKVSFDFDGTLTLDEIKDYAKDLIRRGFDVHIITARYHDEHVHKYGNVQWKMAGNDDIYDFVRKHLRLSKDKIIFCNMEPKGPHINHIPFIFHIDDDQTELCSVQDYTSIITVYAKDPHWKTKCEKAIKLNNLIKR